MGWRQRACLLLWLAALVTGACGGERAASVDGSLHGGRALVDARPAGALRGTPSGWEVQRGSFRVAVDRDAPRVLDIAAAGQAVRVRRIAERTAEAHEDDEVIAVRRGDRTEALVFATARGVEELVWTDEDVRYVVELPPGMRMRVPKARRDAVEIVDWRGSPRVRMLAPRAWNAQGEAHAVEVSVDGATIRVAVPMVGERWLVDPEWQSAGEVRTTRSCISPVTLGDGRVLVTGYGEGGTRTAEIYDPISQTWALVGDTNAPRCHNTSTLLPDGRVLIVGGVGDPAFGEQGSVEMFDPQTETFEVVDSGPARQNHTATRLRDGNVLIVGGFEPNYSPSTGVIITPALTHTQIYDIAQGDLRDVEPLATAVGGHRATLLPDGDVLVSGGRRLTSDGAETSDLWRFDASTESWTLAGNLSTPRAEHAAMLMPHHGLEGAVLIVHGVGGAVGLSDELVDLETMMPTQISPPLLANAWAPSAASMLTPTGDPLLIHAGNPFGPEGIAASLFDVEGDEFSSLPLAAEVNTSTQGAVSMSVLANGDPFVLHTFIDAEGEPGLHSVRYPFIEPQLVDVTPSQAPDIPGADALVPLKTGDFLLLGEDGVRFDPATATTSTASSIYGLDIVGGRHVATPLLDDTIFIFGRDDSEGTTFAEIFNPFTGSAPDLMDLPDLGEVSYTATLMPDGTVMLTGDTGAARFDPEAQSFTPVAVTLQARLERRVVLARDGRLWVYGTCLTPPCPIEVWDPDDGSVVEIATVADARRAIALFDGSLLFAAGDPIRFHLADPVAATFTELAWDTSTMLPLVELVLLPTGRIAAVTTSEVHVFDFHNGHVFTSAPIPTGSTGRSVTLMPDGGVLILDAPTAYAWYEAPPPDPSWRPQFDLYLDPITAGDPIALTASNLLGVAETTDLPSAGRTNHPVAVFMPFGGVPTVGGFHDWGTASVTYTAPIPAQTGPGYLFASVAGQHGAMYATLAPLENGAPCFDEGVCRSGICTDVGMGDNPSGQGVCCEATCGPCEACSASLKTDGESGTCGPVLVDTDPFDHCEADDVSTCQQTGTCDGNGQCSLYTDGTQCSDAGLICIEQECVDGCLTDDDCDAGVCIDQECVTDCTSNAHCPEGQQCGTDGKCTPMLVDSDLACTPCAIGQRRSNTLGGWWLLALAMCAAGRRTGSLRGHIVQ